MECYSSELGTRLQTEVEEKTKQLAAPRDIIPSVPTVVYNNVSYQQDFFFLKILADLMKNINYFSEI